GHGDYCIYTWCDKGNPVEAYVVVDLHEIRNNIKELIFGEKTNFDGSVFKHVTLEELRKYNCIIASKGI
ncbi:MAG: hypothetical protein ACRC5T_02540, partial [Cetobacterium sp.]